MSSEEPINKEAAEAIISFLKANVSKSAIPNIENELKTEFVLAKKRSKVQKRRKTKKKVKSLNRKEKKSLGFYTISRDSVKYNDILPMNQVWQKYISEVLDLDKPIPDCTSKAWENFTTSLYKADFHGSELSVIRSKCPSYVGKSGICIMDTKNTFKLVSRDNVVTTIPKRESVFEMYLNKLKITVFGKHLCVRPAERSTKKIKGRLLPDL
ncbi:unnamed protein product [Arctia plantaginis]|uniref:Ribonuclease P protein subunit p29 n=1 Tax=Arctia plantaginis TaxID=874455 RepID=A0A8S1B2Z2_ARCPL|nr:unnamed protein product [Arctia plantaginis]CAB3256890.1 unnamed protein product [Arctia plantaginis]